MPIFYNPQGNPEVWDEKPQGYITVEEWQAQNPPPEPTDEEKYYMERAAVDVKYSSPWNGATGGILTMLQMTMSAAQCEVPQNPEKIAGIGTEYQAELAAMRAELQAIDEKYGV